MRAKKAPEIEVVTLEAVLRPRPGMEIVVESTRLGGEFYALDAKADQARLIAEDVACYIETMT